MICSWKEYSGKLSNVKCFFRFSFPTLAAPAALLGFPRPSNHSHSPHPRRATASIVSIRLDFRACHAPRDAAITPFFHRRESRLFRERSAEVCLRRAIAKAHSPRAEGRFNAILGERQRQFSSRRDEGAAAEFDVFQGFLNHGDNIQWKRYLSNDFSPIARNCFRSRRKACHNVRRR